MSVETENLSEKLVLNVLEVADRLGVGRTTVYDLIRSGALRSFKIGQRRLVAVEDLRAFIEEARQGRAA